MLVDIYSILFSASTYDQLMKHSVVSEIMNINAHAILYSTVLVKKSAKHLKNVCLEKSNKLFPHRSRRGDRHEGECLPGCGEGQVRAGTVQVLPPASGPAARAP